jgi:uncharacterized membrane protein YbhN (UPF0104 family)
VKLGLTIARIVVAVGLLAYLLWRVDLASALNQIRTSDLGALVAGTVVLAFQPIIGALRWSIILSALGTPIPAGSALRWNYVGVFFGQALPATVGTDFVRIWLAGGSTVGWHDAVVSVALDRLAMLILLALFLLFGLSRIGEITTVPWLGWLIPPVLVCGIAGVLLLTFLDRLIPARLDRHRSVRGLRHVAMGTRRLFASPVALGLTVALCVLSYTSLMTSIFFYARAFGAGTELVDIIVLVPPVLVASMLPVSLGGWGTREIAMVAALGIVGIAPETAVLTSIWLGLSSIIVSLPGALFMILRPMDVKAIRAAAAEE